MMLFGSTTVEIGLIEALTLGLAVFVAGAAGLWQLKRSFDSSGDKVDKLAQSVRHDIKGFSQALAGLTSKVDVLAVKMDGVKEDHTSVESRHQAELVHLRDKAERNAQEIADVKATASKDISGLRAAVRNLESRASCG